MNSISAIVLAAGKSTRIGSIARGLPKPMISFCGEPIISRNLRWMASQGVSDVTINLHYEPDKIREALDYGSQFGLRIAYSVERRLLGTAGAVKKILAERLRNIQDILVVYGDNLMNFSLGSMIAAHRNRDSKMTIALFDRDCHPHTGIAGGRVVLNGQNRISQFVEGADDSISSFVNAGVYLLKPSIVDEIPDNVFYDFGHDLFPKLLKQGTILHGHVIDGYCLGIDTPESYQSALQLVNSGTVELS